MADPTPYPDTSDDTGAGPDRGSPPRTPRWVKGFGIAFLVLVLVIVIMIVIMIAGGHGPGRHIAGGGLGEQTSPYSVTETAV